MRILLADDHPVVRSGLRAVLAAESDVQIIGEEGDGERALEAIRTLQPDVAILDIQMPGLSGIEVARRLSTDSNNKTALVVLSLHKEEIDLQSALDAGVSAYVVKDDAAQDLVEALRAAARGEMYVSPRLTGSLVRALRKGDSTTASTLTQREREVLRLLAEGMRSKEIATRLKLSTKTVESYRGTLMDKLNIRSVAGLVKYALKHRLTDLEG